MKNNRFFGISLIGLALLMIIAMLVKNHIIWFFTDLLVILVAGIVGVLLIIKK